MQNYSIGGTLRLRAPSSYMPEVMVVKGTSRLQDKTTSSSKLNFEIKDRWWSSSLRNSGIRLACDELHGRK